MTTHRDHEHQIDILDFLRRAQHTWNQDIQVINK